MEELYLVLFSWAVTLSGYHTDSMPVVELKSKSFFVKNACMNNENCKVVGWYPATGGNTVYVKDTLDILNNQIAASIVVHEFVHFLQFKNKVIDKTCKQAISLEYEAYGVQKEYLLQNGVLANDVGLTVVSMNCDNG
jgi:hypothetical protein